MDFHGIIRDIEILGCNEVPQWSRDEKGLHLTTTMKSSTPIVFKIKID